MSGTENNRITEAQRQIERLMKLKEQKESKPAGTAAAGRPAAEAAALKRRHPVKRAIPAKKVSMARLERTVYERLHRIMKGINASGGKKITKDRIVNTILKEFFELDIDFLLLKDEYEVKRLLSRIERQ
ncbi:MAG TPA: hypothetical protein ENN43_00430 [bacterium]|nr:hypothetical protein [bacterium]